MQCGFFVLFGIVDLIQRLLLRRWELRKMQDRIMASQASHLT